MPPKYLRNSNTPWTSGDDQLLRYLAAQNTPTRVIGLKLGRSAAAVQTRATQLRVSLKPTNQSPYGLRQG